MTARVLLTLLGLAAAAAPSAAAATTEVHGLTVEHRHNPLGVDAPAPRFGWQMASTEHGQRQTAYQVLVASSQERLAPNAADVWNSGRVRSAESIAIPYGGKALQPSTRYFWTVRVWDRRGDLVGATEPAFFETALLSRDGVGNWDGARWIRMAGKQPSSPGAPMLRKQADLTGTDVRSARLYVSALGVYEAYVNGHRVAVPQGSGKTFELLTPGWTNYDSTVNYMTYDVTDLVASQRQVTLAAVLGNGWYNGRISGSFPNFSKYYSSEGNRLALKAKLLIRFGDGSSQVVVTEPGDGWRATDAGPYRADDIYDGETYDARKEMPGWAASGFDESAWAHVEEDDFTKRFPGSTVVAYPGETARLMSEWDRGPQAITVYTGVTGEETSANGKGRIVVDQSRTVSDPAAAATTPVTIRTGETAIFDLGQNIVGVPRYTLNGPAGAEVVFRLGEMLNDDSAGADGPEGSVYLANLRTAKATSTYVLKGNPDGETHQDSLSFYGFRYASVRVTTPNTSVTISDFTGKVATSAIRDVGGVTTNDPAVNRLYNNVRWGQRGNYLWVPTDCPQRDERQGWTGDTQVFANTGLYNADAVNFLSHFTDSLISSQQTYGAEHAQYPNVSPGGATTGGASGWSDAGVVVPWTLWQMSGDRTIVDHNWDAMAKYMDWQYRRTGPTYLGPGSTFGDWLAFQRTSTQLMSDVYYAYTAALMAQMARGTGRDAEADKYEALFANVKRAFVQKYIGVNPLTGKATVRSDLGTGSPVEPFVNGGVSAEMKPEHDTQTALLWVLKLGLYETEAQRRDLLDTLVENIRNTAAYQQAQPATIRASYAPDTLSVGFLGINVLAPVLTDNGRTDLAYKLLHQDEMPSWLYSVKNGATTIWERWNSYSKEHGFGPVSMNSFNHYAYGAIAEWMYEDMAGISKDVAQPGFKHFFLQPQLDPTGKITEVEGSYLSPYGRITSRWALRGEVLTY
ncbi:MAG TPA: family 78 glycoside hydrolase catalytic domain, partial [Thermoleophilaceae bacterium]|nr:family 78 glycoside hydrolase catalytic domain [Thermoleophilaceae bacterium]